MEDWEKGGTEVTTQMVGFNVVGDFIRGTYTGKKHVETKDVTLYEIKGELGQFHTKDDNGKINTDPTLVEAGAYYQIWGGKNAIDDLFAKSRFGDVVAVQFKLEQPSKTKGYSPFKVFKTLQFGPDASYMGESSDALSQAFPDAEVVETPAPEAPAPEPTQGELK
jgi:hypothetical protein